MGNTAEINGKKVQIDYPCKWQYRIILPKDADAKDSVKKALGDTKFEMEISNKNEKYTSFNVSVEVNDEAQRLKFFSELKKIAKFVL